MDDEHHFSIDYGVTVYYHEPRYPTENPLLEAHTRKPVTMEFRDPDNWIFVFVLKDFTDEPRYEETGQQAILRDIWSYEEPYEEGDEPKTIAVNGGRKVPYCVLGAIAKRPEVDGISRPPYIPERDGNLGDEANLPWVTEDEAEVTEP